MYFARRTALLRVTAMAALAACGVLTSDTLHPGRAFCPLEAACNLASNSPLGSFFGVPTAVLGMAAFGGLLLLTLLPVEWSRRFLRPAGAIAAVAGLGFIAYQALVLQAFCPMCLVADGAGLVAGFITLTWPRPPVRLSGRRLPGESGSSRFGWTFAAALAVVVPFVWPRPEEPAWVEITPPTELAFAELDEMDTMAEPAPVVAPVTPAPAAPPEPPPAAVAAAISPVPPAEASPPPAPSPATVQHPPVQAPPVQAPPVRTAPPQPAPRPAPRPTPQRRVPIIVEYLNAYCTHCRATHRRLDKVVRDMNAPMRVRRVYTWAGKGYPLWVRACAYARTVGREDQMFDELMRARSQRPADVYAAARRAGLDVTAMQSVVSTPNPPARVVHEHALMMKAGIKGLPTIDIGRRRLMGEQSEAELRDAVRAALGTR